MDKRVKVLHLIKSLGRGGAEKLIPETAKVHNQEKYDFFCLYFYHQENNIVDELEGSGIQVELIPSGNLGLFFQVRKVREFIQKKGIDIVHAHLPWAGILSRLVGKEIDIPIVYTEHNTWDRYNSISYWGNRFTFKKQDVAIAVSNEVALSMQLNSIFDPYQRGGRLKVRVIRNGVNTDIFRRIVFGEQGFVNRAQVCGNSDLGLGNRGQEIVDMEDRTLKNYPVDKFSEGPGCGRPIENRDQGLEIRGKEIGDRDQGKGIEGHRDLEIGRLRDHPEKNSESPSPLVSKSGAVSKPTVSNYENSQGNPNPQSRISKTNLENFIAEPSTTHNLKEELSIPVGSKIIGKVAVFRSQKRLWIWVDLALKILELKPETHFLLVGDGEWRERIEEQIEKSGFGNNFHLVGVQKEVIPYLSIMDIYLSTSEFEGLPIAMLEAMSCEVPVVATRAGGIGEIIQHGNQGFLSEIDEYEELVDYCIKLLSDPELQSKMAKSARARVVEKFSMKRMVKEIEAVYESVIS
ncbi:glycosyltransferase [Algoriphagus sediminis]|uniref:Glycosyltransferase n=1 Tax=Algoriphagus sediminis TaxID=3057113 RepID=A0ABT7YDX4_9BACT|nr:glycosyltransferase [Algoriphagus sediminis]MDN3204687.1 glycosyltransferase [Algoriphagus sediminis]